MLLAIRVQLKMRKQYHLITSLKNIYLEDSYVLGIHEKKQSIKFDLDAVLTEDHELYQPPKPSEKYCYHKINLVFENASSIEWLKRENISYEDPDGTVDFGNIDNFEFDKHGFYLLGDWGEIEINGGSIEVILTNGTS